MVPKIFLFIIFKFVFKCNLLKFNIMGFRLIYYICLCLLFFINFASTLKGQIPETDRLDSMQLRTLASLERLNDHLYLMHYNSDYHFDSFIEEGTRDMSFDDFINKYLGKVPEQELWACSAFKVKNGRASLLGRNFDWENIPGIILFTSPDSAYRSVSMVPADLLINIKAVVPEENKGLLWAPYFPVEGINEKGLVVMELAVEGEKAHIPGRVNLFSLHLIRLLLDKAAGLDEAIDLLGRYNNMASERMHFFIADSSGSSAVVEYIDNDLAVTRNDGGWQVVTNTMVQGKSEKKLRKGCGRYNYLSQYLEAHSRALLEPGAFNILRAVAVDKVINSQFKITTSTQWSVIYDLEEKSLSVVSRRNFATRYSYSLFD